MVKRIHDEVDNPAVRDQMTQEVEKGKDLSNPEAAQVYNLETEPGAGLFSRFIIGTHAQYRMDLRGITVPHIRASLRSFEKQMSDWKSRRDYRFSKYSELLTTGKPAEWEDKILGLTVVIVLKDRDAKIVTVYWEGEADPNPPGLGHCPVVAYRQPADQLPGVQTVVTKPDGSQPGETTTHQYKERALPSPPWKREKPTGKPEYQSPPGSGGGGTSGGDGIKTPSDGKNLHEDKVRTKGEPGDERPVPDVTQAPAFKRRQIEGIDASLVNLGPRMPLYRNRQHKQRGDAKRYYQRNYRKNRSKIKRRMTRWVKKYKNRFNYQKSREKRRDFPLRFKRLPGNIKEPKQRSKEWREEQKKLAQLEPPIEVIYLPKNLDGYLLGVDLDTGLAKIVLESGEEQSVPLDSFLTSVYVPEEADVDRFMAYLDQAFEWMADEDEGPEEDDDPALDKAFDEWLDKGEFHYMNPAQRVAGRYSEMFYEKRPVEGEPSAHYDRAKTLWPEVEQSGEPADKMDQGTVWNDPGSAKVIPDGHDFENKQDKHDNIKMEITARLKEAIRISEIEDSCGADLRKRSEGIPIRLVRADEKNRLWLFNVTGREGTYRVRVKASTKGNITDINKADVHVSCSCPFWQWQGPEHWAKQKDYLYGRPRGTASFPHIKDPAGRHGACKHVLAVLKRVSGFLLPRKRKVTPKTASLRYLADKIQSGRIVVTHSGMEGMIQAVVGRYGGTEG